MTILILIIFFVSLIIYQIYLLNYPIIEGATTQTADDNKQYQDYSENELILSKKNAGNIEVLKGRIDDLDEQKSRVDTMQQNIYSMQTQIDALVQQQADYATDLAGSEPVTITGTEEDEE